MGEKKHEQMVQKSDLDHLDSDKEWEGEGADDENYRDDPERKGSQM